MAEFSSIFPCLTCFYATKLQSYGLIGNFNLTCGELGRERPLAEHMFRVGTTRPRVSFSMNKFRKLGFIKYNGGIHVNDSLLSVVLHD